MRQVSGTPSLVPLFIGLALLSLVALVFRGSDLSTGLIPSSPSVESTSESFGIEEPLASATALNQRKLYRGFATDDECEELIGLLAQHTSLRKVPHSVGLFTLSNRDIADHADKRGVATLARLRSKMIRLAKQYFQRDDVWPQTTNLAVRKPEFVDDPICERAHNCSDDYLRSVEWSSSVHADNCMWQPWDEQCVFLPCCHMRAYSLILYLNECSGGEFIFPSIGDAVPVEKILPLTGSLVMFPGTADNRHGVGRVRDTRSRYTLYLWLTHSEEFAEPALLWMGA